MGFVNNGYRCSECAKSYSADQLKTAIFKENDAKVKCPEKNCNKNLSFREFLNGSCCSVAMRKSKSRVESINCRADFQDLTKKMKELEILEIEENEAKIVMENKKKELDAATTKYSEKNSFREQLQAELARALTETSETLVDNKGSCKLFKTNLFHI